MTADLLTTPERSRSRAQARQVRAAVIEEGGCCYCTQRASIFEGVGRLAACGLSPPKSFPACIAFGHFEFDEPAFREGAGRNLFVGAPHGD